MPIHLKIIFNTSLSVTGSSQKKWKLIFKWVKEFLENFRLISDGRKLFVDIFILIKIDYQLEYFKTEKNTRVLFFNCILDTPTKICQSIKILPQNIIRVIYFHDFFIFFIISAYKTKLDSAIAHWNIPKVENGETNFQGRVIIKWWTRQDI